MESKPVSTEPKVEVTFVMWEYAGRQVPMEIRWPTGQEWEDQFINAMADFLWKNRHMAKKHLNDRTLNDGK